MDWQIQVTNKAEKSLKKIPNPYKANLKEAIDELPDLLNSHHTKKLSGTNRDLYRLRVGQYRIVYERWDQKMIIVVIHITHRSDVYEGL